MGLISRALDTQPKRKGEVFTRHHYDENGDREIIERIQDVEPVLKQNQEMRSNGDGYTAERDMVHVGQIPMIVIEKIMKEEKWDPLAAENVERLHALLDDPKYFKFRTSEGKVSHKPLREYFRGSTGKIMSRRAPQVLSAKPVFWGNDE